jgi:DNA-binding beta-propeller fold protein YncE
MLALPGGALGFEPLSSVGVLGDGAGQLEKPYGVVVADDGTAYAAEYGNDRVSVFAGDGSFLRAFGKGVHPAGGDICIAASGCLEGVADGAAASLAGPKGIAFGPEGNLFVADTGDNRIAVYSLGGVFIRAFGKGVNAGVGDVCTSECQAGEGGEGAADMAAPAGLEFDSLGRLYVADYGNDRVDVFAADGSFLWAFGKEVEQGGVGGVCTEITGCEAGAADESAGSIFRPYDVAVLPGEALAVADEGNNRVDVFTAGGTFLRASGKEVNPPGGDVCSSECQAGSAASGAAAFKGPSAVAATADGDLYVADPGNNRVSELDANGEFTRAFGQGAIDGAAQFQVCTEGTGCQAGTPGLGLGAISLPFGLAVDCFGAVYVAEQGIVSRVERFGEPGTPSPPCPPPPPPPPPAAISVALVPTSAAISNRFRFAGLKLNRGNGSAVLFVRVPTAGKLILWGRGVRRFKRTAHHATLVRLPIRPKTPLKRYLKRHRKAPVHLKVAFEPFGGVAKTREKRIVLRRKLRR